MMTKLDTFKYCEQSTTKIMTIVKTILIIALLAINLADMFGTRSADGLHYLPLHLWQNLCRNRSECTLNHFHLKILPPPVQFLAM